MEDLVGKMVIVQTAEADYIGRLVEMSDEEVYLQAENGWVVVPIERVTGMREKTD